VKNSQISYFAAVVVVGTVVGTAVVVVVGTAGTAGTGVVAGIVVVVVAVVGVGRGFVRRGRRGRRCVVGMVVVVAAVVVVVGLVPVALRMCVPWVGEGGGVRRRLRLLDFPVLALVLSQWLPLTQRE